MSTHLTLTTEQLAEQLHVAPQSIRARLSREGHYFGLKPTKLPNRRLLWPANALEELQRRSTEQAAA